METQKNTVSFTDEQKDAAATAIARVVSDAIGSRFGLYSDLDQIAVGAAKALRAGFAEFNRAD